MITSGGSTHYFVVNQASRLRNGYRNTLAQPTVPMKLLSIPAVACTADSVNGARVQRSSDV